MGGESEKEIRDDDALNDGKQKDLVDVTGEVAAGIVEGIHDVAKKNSKVAKKILDRPPHERLRAAIAAVIALIPILLKYVAPGMLGHAQTALMNTFRGRIPVPVLDWHIASFEDVAASTPGGSFVTSPAFTLRDGSTWAVRLYPNGEKAKRKQHNPSISLYAVAMDLKTPVTVRVKLEVVNGESDRKSVSRAFLHTFKANFELHGFASLLPASRVWAPDSGFLVPSKGAGKPELRIRAFADLKSSSEGTVERKSPRHLWVIPNFSELIDNAAAGVASAPIESERFRMRDGSVWFAQLHPIGGDKDFMSLYLISEILGSRKRLAYGFMALNARNSSAHFKFGEDKFKRPHVAHGWSNFMLSSDAKETQNGFLSEDGSLHIAIYADFLN